MTSGLEWTIQTDNPAFAFYKDGTVSEKSQATALRHPSLSNSSHGNPSTW